MPGGDTTEGAVGGPGLPDCSELPSERAAHGPEDGFVDLDRPLRFRKDSGDRVLQNLEIARVSEPLLSPLEVRHR